MKQNKRSLLKQSTAFRMWKSGKKWLFASSTYSKWLSMTKKSVEEIKVDLVEKDDRYQKIYSEKDDEPHVLHQGIRVAGGLFAGFGASFLGGGCFTTGCFCRND